MKEFGDIPEGIVDIWEATGCRPEVKYTWDMRRNDNIGLPGRQKPQFRFDRLYMRSADTGPEIKPVYFELVGVDRLRSCQRYPSDHWGILGHFNVLDRQGS